MKIKYTAHGASIDGGRTGSGFTDDGKVSVKLSVPREMGGDGGPGTNPEQLFAVGYSACFLGSLKTAAQRMDRKLPQGATVSANVSFADREDGVGFTIVPELMVAIPGWSQPEIEEAMRIAHDVCPYSNLIRFAHDVKLTAGELAAA